jgi:hypothetical protein
VSNPDEYSRLKRETDESINVYASAGALHAAGTG